jgi:hypothetical protein
LMTPGVLRALSEQHLGNPRAMMKCANQLLDAALLAEQTHIQQAGESKNFSEYLCS